MVRADISFLHQSFCYVDDPRMIFSMNYATLDNFIGRPIAAYHRQFCILTKEARHALIAVQDELDTYQKNYCLRIFDAYRPASAVADFGQWLSDLNDQKMRSIYYPHLQKPQLVELGYLKGDQSSHSRGSTVDLTIAIRDLKSYTDLDMGTIIDYFDEASHTASTAVSETAQENRQFLKTLMEKHGFDNYPKEWWHYTLKHEPYPDTYFDFHVR